MSNENEAADLATTTNFYINGVLQPGSLAHENLRGIEPITASEISKEINDLLLDNYEAAPGHIGLTLLNQVNGEIWINWIKNMFAFKTGGQLHSFIFWFCRFDFQVSASPTRPVSKSIRQPSKHSKSIYYMLSFFK